MFHGLGHQIYLLMLQGKKSPEIAQILSVSLSTVYKYRKEYLANLNIGLSTREIKNVLAYKLYLGGMPVKEIMRFLEISNKTAYQIMDKYKKENITLDFKISQIGIIE